MVHLKTQAKRARFWLITTFESVPEKQCQRNPCYFRENWTAFKLVTVEGVARWRGP